MLVEIYFVGLAFSLIFYNLLISKQYKVSKYFTFLMFKATQIG